MRRGDCHGFEFEVGRSSAAAEELRWACERGIRGADGNRGEQVFSAPPTACINLQIDFVSSVGEVGDDFCFWQRFAEFGVELNGESAIDSVSSQEK